MLQKIISSLLSSVTVKMFSFIASVLIARRLGSEGRGELAIITSIYSLGLLAGSMGYVESMLSCGKEDKAALKGIFQHILVYSLSVGLVVVVGSIGYTWIMHSDQDVRSAMVVYSWGAPFALMMAFGLNLSLLVGDVKLYNRASVVQGAVYPLCVVLFGLSELSVLKVLCSLLLALLSGNAYLAFKLKSKYWQSISAPFSLKQSGKFWISMSKRASSNFVLTACYGVASQIPLLYLAYTSNHSAVGLFSVAYGIVLLAVSLIIPSMAIITASEYKDDVLVKMVLACLVLGVICFICTWYFGSLIFGLVYGTQFSVSGHIFLWLVPYTFMLTAAQFLTAALRREGKYAFAAKSAAFSLGVMVVCGLATTRLGFDSINAVVIAMSLFAGIHFIAQFVALRSASQRRIV